MNIGDDENELHHWPLGLDEFGSGPETDLDRIERVVCARCGEEWPCSSYREPEDDMTDPMF